MKIILLILVLLCSSGCATIYTQAADIDCDNKCYNISHIYSGTSSDLCEIQSNTSSPLNGYILVDLPFSFVLDTVILPFTIYKQNTKGSLCD